MKSEIKIYMYFAVIWYRMSLARIVKAFMKIKFFFLLLLTKASTTFLAIKKKKNMYKLTTPNDRIFIFSYVNNVGIQYTHTHRRVHNDNKTTCAFFLYVWMCMYKISPV